MSLTTVPIKCLLKIPITNIWKIPKKRRMNNRGQSHSEKGIFTEKCTKRGRLVIGGIPTQ
jgi:hypothetical protein